MHRVKTHMSKQLIAQRETEKSIIKIIEDNN